MKKYTLIFFFILGTWMTTLGHAYTKIELTPQDTSMGSETSIHNTFDYYCKSACSKKGGVYFFEVKGPTKGRISSRGQIYNYTANCFCKE